MNHAVVEENLRTSYRSVWEQYRRDDEIEVTTENHSRLHRKLADICLSFDRPISVLEAGCGSGRYFHCLKNVKYLVGLDLSPDMLKAARHPVHSDLIEAQEVRLVCESVYRADFPPGSFDFIYSLGMFGNGAPVTVELCNRFHTWLAPGGVLFFNAVHRSSLEQRETFRQSVRRLAYPLMPGPVKRMLDRRAERLPSFGLTESQLADVLRATPFHQFEITTQVCQSPLWKGSHLECTARR